MRIAHCHDIAVVCRISADWHLPSSNKGVGCDSGNAAGQEVLLQLHMRPEVEFHADGIQARLHLHMILLKWNGRATYCAEDIIVKGLGDILACKLTSTDISAQVLPLVGHFHGRKYSSGHPRSSCHVGYHVMAESNATRDPKLRSGECRLRQKRRADLSCWWFDFSVLSTY